VACTFACGDKVDRKGDTKSRRRERSDGGDMSIVSKFELEKIWSRRVSAGEERRCHIEKSRISRSWVRTVRMERKEAREEGRCNVNKRRMSNGGEASIVLTMSSAEKRRMTLIAFQRHFPA
jgi:hypothetical protein